jgi:hypothetical protein
MGGLEHDIHDKSIADHVKNAWPGISGRRAVAADDRPVRACDVAGAVGVGSQFPAHLVQDDVVVPPEQ